MFLSNLKNAIFSNFMKARDTLAAVEEKALESLPEPYIPSTEEITAMPEKLREKAAKALNGSGANPSQLGDPISLKAEQSDNVPKPEEKGAESASTSRSTKSISSKSDNTDKGPGKKGAADGKETLREKAMKKIDGPDANPSQLGDPVSLKAETTEKAPKPQEEGARKKRDSKL